MQSIYEQKLLRTIISQRDIFSNSIAFTVINKYGKGGVVQISRVFGALNMLLVKGSSETGIFRNLFQHVFQSP